MEVVLQMTVLGTGSLFHPQTSHLQYGTIHYTIQDQQSVNNIFTLLNPIIPGVQKPYSARGGASEAPRVKSQHSGLPDDPMPYNGNYILCLGIN